MRNTDDSEGTVVHVFAYGSNMCTARLRDRTASARPVAVGYVTERRLAFHKRSVDGSGKADAAFTGNPADRVWGVVFEVLREDAERLDSCEPAYDPTHVFVETADGPLAAFLYVARREVVDPSLVPFRWYHAFVVSGAVEHGLPDDYVAALRAIEAVADPDRDRAARNAALLRR